MLLVLANVLLPSIIHDDDGLTAARTLVQVLLKVSLVALVVSVVFAALLVGAYVRSRKRAN